MNTKSTRTPKTTHMSTEKPTSKAGRASNSKPIPFRLPGKAPHANKDATTTSAPRASLAAKQINNASKSKDDKPSTPEPEPFKLIDLDGEKLQLFESNPTGDIILDVTFSNTNCRRSLLGLGTGQQPRFSSFSVSAKAKSPDERVLYRVHLATLIKTSKYFERLLTDERFKEANTIKQGLAKLEERGVEPAAVTSEELPRIEINEEDDASLVSGRSSIFGDLLRILHGGEATSKLSIHYLSISALMADRFDCAPAIGRYIRGSKRIPWPQTYGQVTFATEEATRMKILVAWLLEDSAKFMASTRELIMRGSLRWSGKVDPEKDQVGLWWDLPDGIEAELHHRRACILSCISSLQAHFIALYTSRKQQCKMFYDSSVACDSFQLGEMIKFFGSKDIFQFVSPIYVPEDFEYPEPYSGDIDSLIGELRKCPSWQYDKNHAHCGLRTRLIPALDYIQSILGQGVGIDWKSWKRDRLAATWEGGGEKGPRLTRSVMGNARLKVQGLMGSKMARELFTGVKWDWTAEEEAGKQGVLGRNFNTSRPSLGTFL